MNTHELAASIDNRLDAMERKMVELKASFATTRILMVELQGSINITRSITARLGSEDHVEQAAISLRGA